jgi:hypothetical protein
MPTTEESDRKRPAVIGSSNHHDNLGCASLLPDTVAPQQAKGVRKRSKNVVSTLNSTEESRSQGVSKIRGVVPPFDEAPKPDQATSNPAITATTNQENQTQNINLHHESRAPDGVVSSSSIKTEPSEDLPVTAKYEAYMASENQDLWRAALEVYNRELAVQRDYTNRLPGLW